jgi:hypothetical protein
MPMFKHAETLHSINVHKTENQKMYYKNYVFRYFKVFYLMTLWMSGAV